MPCRDRRLCVCFPSPATAPVDRPAAADSSFTLATRSHRRRSLKTAAGRVTAAAALAGCVITGSAEAQPPYHQEVLPGLSALDLGAYTSPTQADLDGDGDLDTVVTTIDPPGQNAKTRLRYLENVGSPTMPVLVERTGTASPIDGLNPDLAYHPELADLDGDGDFDLLAGNWGIGAILHFFENIGTPTNPVFELRTGASNPFDDLDLAAFAGYMDPHLLDLDDDGDLDLALDDGTFLRYFENTGSLLAPVFERRNGPDNPFNIAGIADAIGLDTGDLDHDGDLDAVIGHTAGTLAYIENTGSASAPALVIRTGTDNPFDGLGIGSDSDPSVADLDGDGRIDVTVGMNFGILHWLQNTGSPQVPAFVAVRGSASPFGDGYVGGRSDLAVGDLDGDGDLDGVAGAVLGSLYYFENTGSATAPSFVQRIGPADPLPFNFIAESNLDLIDLDGDLDLDAVVGNFFGELHYLENVGSQTSPSFIERIGAANPFDGVDLGFNSSPNLVDLDGDGDLDAVIGEGGGTLTYFENVGSTSSPVFT